MRKSLMFVAAIIFAFTCSTSDAFARVKKVPPGQRSKSEAPKKTQRRAVKKSNYKAKVAQPRKVASKARRRQVARVPVSPQYVSPRVINSVINASYSASGVPLLGDYGSVVGSAERSNHVVDQFGNRVNLTTDSSLQDRARRLLAESRVPWGAIVAIEPKTGRVLAIAGFSQMEEGGDEVAVRSTFPAASLFKVITASAAVERSGMSADSVINYRGGTYTLNESNYRPDSKRDQHEIGLETALAKSCNPAFGRIALNKLSSPILERYAESFLFNRDIPFELPHGKSTFVTPQTDYELARTAAGFGEALLSPLHAAMIAAAVANHGVLMRPYIVDSVVSPSGAVKYRAHPQALQRAVLSSTANQVLEMMNATIVEGTARRHFQGGNKRILKNIRIAGKTGTLRGSNPQGVYHWFIGAAPIGDPKIAIATLVIDPGFARVGGVALGAKFMENFFSDPSSRQFVSNLEEHGPG